MNKQEFLANEKIWKKNFQILFWFQLDQLAEWIEDANTDTGFTFRVIIWIIAFIIVGIITMPIQLILVILDIINLFRKKEKQQAF